MLLTASSISSGWSRALANPGWEKDGGGSLSERGLPLPLTAWLLLMSSCSQTQMATASLLPQLHFCSQGWVGRLCSRLHLYGLSPGLVSVDKVLEIPSRIALAIERQHRVSPWLYKSGGLNASAGIGKSRSLHKGQPCSPSPD